MAESRQRTPLAQVTSPDALPEPEPAYTRRPETETETGTGGTCSDHEREATELHAVGPARASSRHSRVLSPPATLQSRWYDPARKFWRHHVRISVPHKDCRDHLANERTYLGYLRTSLALAMLGVLIAQLYRLQHSPTPDPTFGYYVLSKPISCIFHASAAGVAILGAVRFFRQQHSMAIGKVYAGGWELMIIGAYVLLILLAMFAFHVGISIRKS